MYTDDSIIDRYPKENNGTLNYDEGADSMKFKRSNNNQVRKDDVLWDETDEEGEDEYNSSHDLSSEDEKNESQESECEQESPNKEGPKTTTKQLIKKSNKTKLNIASKDMRARH